jgi:hypothetical protein
MLLGGASVVFPREEIGLRLDVSQGSNLDVFFSVSKLFLLVLLSLFCRVYDITAKVLRLGGKYFR